MNAPIARHRPRRPLPGGPRSPAARPGAAPACVRLKATISRRRNFTANIITLAPPPRPVNSLHALVTAALWMPHPGSSLGGSPRAPAARPRLAPARAAMGAGGRHCAGRPAEPPAALERKNAVLAEARPNVRRIPCSAPPPCRALRRVASVRHTRRGPAAARSGGALIAPPAPPHGIPAIDGRIKEAAARACGQAAGAATAAPSGDGRRQS